MHPIDQIKQFARLTPEIEDNLLRIMKQRSVRKGEIIRGAVNIANYALYIIRGSARIFYTQGGREHTIAFFFEDEYIIAGKTYLLNHTDTIAVEFLEPTDIIYIPHLQLKDYLEGSSRIDDVAALIYITNALFRYNNFLEDRIHALQTLNAHDRYHWAITRYPRLLNTATITQIASFLGLTKETLYRIRHNSY